ALVVTVTGDAFVNKGPSRPAFLEGLRAEMLAALQCVDWVGINRSSDAISAIEHVRTDICVKGQDYQDPEGDITGKIKYERQAVEAHGGGRAFTHDFVLVSTSVLNTQLRSSSSCVR